MSQSFIGGVEWLLLFMQDCIIYAVRRIIQTVKLINALANSYGLWDFSKSTKPHPSPDSLSYRGSLTLNSTNDYAFNASSVLVSTSCTSIRIHMVCSGPICRLNSYSRNLVVIHFGLRLPYTGLPKQGLTRRPSALLHQKLIESQFPSFHHHWIDTERSFK